MVTYRDEGGRLKGRSSIVNPLTVVLATLAVGTLGITAYGLRGGYRQQECAELRTAPAPIAARYHHKGIIESRAAREAGLRIGNRDGRLDAEEWRSVCENLNIDPVYCESPIRITEEDIYRFLGQR